MSDTTEATQSEGIAAPPPAGDFETPKARKRRSTKGTIIMGAAVVVVGLLMWKLFLSKSDSPLTLDGHQVSPGRSQIEGTVSQGGAGGGMRQEYAQIQSDIEEEEKRQERIIGGRSSIQLGENNLLTDEEKQDGDIPPPANSTFGMIAPEPAQPAPSNNVIQPGRRSVNMSPGAGNYNGGSPGNAGILAEMQRIEEQSLADSGWNAVIDYAETTESPGQAGVGRSRMPITPGLEERYYGGSSGRSDSSRPEVGAYAMPGDTIIAYMENRVSSDQPSGRVVAHILSGELQGAKAIGQATFQGERLLVEFNRVVTSDGELLDGISMLAVDPTTLETSLQSGIDRKLFLRYGVPILYGVAGLGIEYAAERERTSVIVEDLETGRTTRRSSSSNESFGEFAGQRIASNLNRPLSDAASRAASAKSVAWADPGIIGLAVDTPIPVN